MKVPSDYYEAEVRDGFYVPSEMKRCWASTIDVLEVIDNICRKHDLKYFAEYGTLLGAVRHGGFIPWDDDFDISMPREDYMVFLKVAEDELPENYHLLSVYKFHRYDNFLSRVVNMDFISLEEEFLKKNHNFPFAVGVDIFPLDYFDYNKKENEVIKNLIITAQNINVLLDPEIIDLVKTGHTLRKSITEFCKMSGMKLQKGKPIRQQIFQMIERLCQFYDKSAPYMTNMYFWVLKNKQVYKKEYFENTIRLPFEYFEINAPIGYDEKLMECYGSNYMVPYKEGGMHDYPLYGKQKALLVETTGKNYFKEYSFEKKDIERLLPEKPERTRREIVFLPFMAKYWPYMEQEWKRTLNEEDTDVYVIPIPYYDKGLYGLANDIHYEADKFPDYVTITPFDQYDFDKHIPDRIVIQNPYDDYDNAVTVHPRFYTDVLLQETTELVYIPYFVIDDGNLDDEKTKYTADFYIKTPGVTRSDKVLLHSEKVRELYIEKLCEFAGEETKSVWQKRLEVGEYILPETAEGIREEDIPSNWWKYLLDGNDEGKKVVLFHTNVSDIVSYNDRYFEKLTRVLSLFREQSDKMTIIWHAHSDTKRVLEERYPELWINYKEIHDRFIKDDFGIYDDKKDYSRSVAISDAYYGDRDAIMHDFVQTGRPTMIMNIEV